MTSQVQICNLALGKLAQDITITSLTERSKEARVFSRLWDPMRDLVLADRLWPWAMKAQRLAVAAEAPMPGWEIRYSRPSDCITVLAITDDQGMRAGRRLSRWCAPQFRQCHGIQFEQAMGTDGTSLLCDRADAYLIYVARVEDPERYPAHFVDALACKLAEEGAPTIIGANGFTFSTRQSGFGQLRDGAFIPGERVADADRDATEGVHRLTVQFGLLQR